MKTILDVQIIYSFVKLLSAEPKDNGVSFDFCNCIPGTIDSYRGYYEDLAIGWEIVYRPVLVKDLIDALNGCIDKVFTGYKGGQYLMTNTTRLWVANNGESTQTGIIGLCKCDYKTIIETAYCGG